MFCRKKTKHDYLVGAGLSGTHFCWHQLCGILLGIHLREVGLPSRTILHGKGVGWKSRNRVTTGVGCFFDEKIAKNERNTITSWIRPPQGPSLFGSGHAGYIYKFQKSYVFEKNMFCRKKTKHDYLVGAGLSGTHFCWHKLCGILLGILFFANCTRLKYIRTRYVKSLRRDRRTSFFALFSEGFLDALVAGEDV